MSTLTPLLAQLKHAVKLAEQIESLQAELADVMRTYSSTASHLALTPPAHEGTGHESKPRGNRVSPEGRARIAEAQKRRWAKFRQS